jgi:hypothetical protein
MEQVYYFIQECFYKVSDFDLLSLKLPLIRWRSVIRDLQEKENFFKAIC